MFHDPVEESAGFVKEDPKEKGKVGGKYEEDGEEEEEKPPWWATVYIRILVVVLFVVILTTCLLAFGKARMSAKEVEDLQEQIESGRDVPPKKAYIIDVPARCPQGHRFFRGKCRRVY